MPRHRLLATYIVRVVLKDGEKSIMLHDLRTRDTVAFRSYSLLIEHLRANEEALAQCLSSAALSSEQDA